MKPDNCNADLSSLDAGGNDGPTVKTTPASFALLKLITDEFSDMVVMAHADTSRTPKTDSVLLTHHLVSVRTI
ncbi:hypothetical protein TNCV_4883241 [Trichonephila clavipes]|nr:hypothetical protein TNCV_4883241 [Trichonephila clavipes]